ncbi:hypothetical protein Goarm_018603 [Gossypium armourianum]|uniref:RNase H type-1 domain-containing protein n=1 Tax=Gossypium armourianum TaxID=34283 RepID=A0A7J9IIU6_9ROSI|nr:hypothetical protein [Gossypium armourianum]
MIWSLWFHRNLYFWKAAQVPSEQIVTFVNEFWRAWEDAGQVYAVAGRRELGGRRDSVCSWAAPTSGWLKCNIDASHSVVDESIGFAAVVRDLYGHVIRGFIGWMEGLVKPLLAEAIAIWESLSWLKTLYMDRVVVESDCSRIIEALPISHSIDSEFSRILHGCSQLRSSFGFLSFCWTYRDANKVTHTLARVALLHAKHPINVQSIISSDFTSLVHHETEGLRTGYMG